tara:strand:- start:6 stop:839 length:834 start_codon:yes stop_codon:yes gene_type:complete
MSLNFKNMGFSLSGLDSNLNSSYYADSISISESLNELNFGTLGGNSVNTVSARAPEGSIDVSFYITTGAEIDAITGHYGRTGFIELRAGPFTAKQSLLQSFNFAVEPLGMIMGSMNYNYYGQIHSGSAASTPSAPTILPAHGARSSLALENIGVTNAIGVSYDFSQSYDVGYSLGQTGPARVTFQEMTKTISVDAQAQDVSFSQSSLTGNSGLCANLTGEEGFSIKSGTIGLNNLCNENIANLGVTGYIESRDFTASPNENVAQSISLIEVSKEGEC